jgi:lysophospholipase L1-like esterase
MAIPVDYDILTSPNSTNGTDGTWTIALSIKKNSVTARAHIIDFTGSQWVKMLIAKGGGSIDEIEVFEMTAESNDTWFFAGTSISANSFKSTPPEKSFADLITESHASFTPAIIRGGIPCINSTTMINDISKYLSVAGEVKYWAIEMGTNDAWGGTNSNVAAYKTNMQKVIDSCKARGIQPIISRIIGTDSAKAKWQVHPDYLKAIDSLTIKNKLIPGPDLYTYFSKHPSELSDGVHPTAAGGASVFRLWAQKMDSLYSAGASTIIGRNATDKTLSTSPCKITCNGGSFIHSKDEGILSVYSLKGTLIKKVFLPAHGSYNLANIKGVFVIDFSSKVGKESFSLSNISK